MPLFTIAQLAKAAHERPYVISCMRQLIQETAATEEEAVDLYYALQDEFPKDEFLFIHLGKKVAPPPRTADPHWWGSDIPIPQADILKEFDEMIAIQTSDGTWNYDPYLHGMANGMIYMRSLISGEDPKYLDAPEEWLRDRDAQNEMDDGFVEIVDLF